MNNKFRILTALALLLLMTACNHRPNGVINAANVTGVELAAIKAGASRQQQVFNSRLASLSHSIAEHEERTKNFERRSQFLPLLWRIRDDKARLRFIAEIKSGDSQLATDPYLLVRRPPPPNPAAAVIDTSGLDSAMEGVGRIADQPPLSEEAGAELIFNALQKVEIPKQPQANK